MPKQTGAGRLPIRHAAQYLRQRSRLQLKVAAGVEPIIVYQMGKVGSSALAQAIDNVPGYVAVQVHRLMPDRCAEIRRRFANGERHYRDMRLEEWLYAWLQDRTAPLKIVTAVREPMAHSYSSFFQNIARSTRGRVTHPGLEQLPSLQRYFLEWEELGAALTWLDKELSRFIGTDLVALPFDLSTGWRRTTTDRHDVLLLKSELSDQLKREVLANFLQRNMRGIARANTASRKPHAELYRTFIAEVKLPISIASVWMKHRYTRTFYTRKEIDSAFARYVG